MLKQLRGMLFFAAVSGYARRREGERGGGVWKGGGVYTTLSILTMFFILKKRMTYGVFGDWCAWGNPAWRLRLAVSAGRSQAVFVAAL